MAQQAFQLNNPAGLYDPAPNAYSHVARLEPGVRLVCLAGQGGERRATHQYGVTAFSDCHSPNPPSQVSPLAFRCNQSGFRIERASQATHSRRWTRSMEDFASADLLRTVVESCPTKLLLANPSLDRHRYTELFQLNEMEMDLLTGLIARQQILLKRPDLTKVLTLTVDPKSYWIYTNTPVDNARVAETFQQYGFEAGMLCTDGEWKPVFHQED